MIFEGQQMDLIYIFTNVKKTLLFYLSFHVVFVLICAGVSPSSIIYLEIAYNKSLRMVL